ncbi:hypothetical protein G6F36_013313 [Rhizopus arrhizus]|nr:hypothetical protein G6F36_013313 [Rhizopus arrhizus]
MIRNNTQHLYQNLEIVLLGTLGIGTIAWFIKNQVSSRLSHTTTASTKKAEIEQESPKQERNFVKVMQQQVK